MTKEYIEDIAIDPDIYNNWPAALQKSWIGFFPGSGDTAACFIVGVDESANKQVVELSTLPNVYCPAKMNIFAPEGQNDVMLVYGIWVQPEWRLKGVASFLLVVARTWLAETQGVKLMVQQKSLNSESSATLQSVQNRYNVSDEEVFYYKF